MPKKSAELLDEISLAYLLRDKGLTHLRVRRSGTLLVLESGPKTDAERHARFRRQSAQVWQLEMPYRSKWEVTPFRGRVDELLEILISTLPWTLAPVGTP